MKFIVSSANLLKQLTSLSGVVPSNPIMPILENFLFKVTANKLIVTASDMQNSMTAEINVDSDEDGNVAVPAKMLIETLRNLPEQPVTFVLNTDTYTLEIISDKGRYRLAGENAEDFPEPPKVEMGKDAVELSSEVLSSAIAYTLFSVSNDEMRPAMNGVYINVTATNATFVSTDTHRLVRYRRSDVSSPVEAAFIIPKKTLTLLKNALPSDNTPLSMYFNKTNAYFIFSNIKLSCRLIDERFPDYENVIPLNNSNSLKVSRTEFIGSLKRIAIYANKSTNLVKFKFAGEDTLTVSAEDLDFSNEASETLNCTYEGKEMEIGFQARMFSEMLSNLHSPEISLQMSEPNRAALLVSTETYEKEDILMLVMPVNLASYY